MSNTITLFSTIGTKVKLNSTELNKVQSIGQIGAEPTLIDATCLLDEARVNIPGVQEYGNWALVCFYNDEDVATIAAAETASKTAPVPLEVELANGDKYSTTCVVSKYVQEIGVNDTPKINASCVLQAAWTYTAHQ